MASSQSPGPSGGFDLGRWMLFGVAGLVAIVVGLSLSVLVFGPPGQSRGVAVSGDLGTTGKALVGGPFQLTDHTGRAVDESLLKGQMNLVYFGFTYCPDFCPTELANMTAAKDALAERGVPVRLIFITIDPQRDDQETLAQYVGAFDPQMIGLRGTADQTKQAAQAYRTVYRRVENEDAADGYTMDHTTLVYAMGPDGEFVTHFSYGTPPEKIADRLERALPK